GRAAREGQALQGAAVFKLDAVRIDGVQAGTVIEFGAADETTRFFTAALNNGAGFGGVDVYEAAVQDQVQAGGGRTRGSAGGWAEQRLQTLQYRLFRLAAGAGDIVRWFAVQQRPPLQGLPEQSGAHCQQQRRRQQQGSVLLQPAGARGEGQ